MTRLIWSILVAIGVAFCPESSSPRQAAASAVSPSTATVDGIPVHSTASGKGPRTVMLVHGWTCDERTWQSQVPELAKDYRVITLDLPGHGRSGSPKDGKLSMDLFARAIEAVRREHAADRVVLVGHSMGTAAILQYARLYPRHVDALVLVDGAVSAYPSVTRDWMLSTAKRYGESPKDREMLAQKMFFSVKTPGAVRSQVLSMVVDAPATTALPAMEALVDPGNWKEDTFTQPVLAIFSSIVATPEGRESDLGYMKTRFPDLKYFKMPDVGHFLMLEQPAEFNRLLRSFLDELK